MTPYHSDGAHRLMAAYRLNTEKARLTQAAGAGILEDPERDTPLPGARSGDGGRWELRGVPVIGACGAWGGAIPGTRPG